MLVGFLLFLLMFAVGIGGWKLWQQDKEIDFLLKYITKNFLALEKNTEEIQMIYSSMTELSKILSQDVQNLQTLKMDAEEFQKSMADFCLALADQMALLSQTSLLKKELKSPAVSSLNFGKKNDKQKPN